MYVRLTATSNLSTEFDDVSVDGLVPYLVMESLEFRKGLQVMHMVLWKEKSVIGFLVSE